MVQDAIDKAKVLIEALPYMRRFVGKTIVLKYGGAAMKDAALRASFAVDVGLLKQIGLRPVIVHGGGPQIGALLERLGRTSTFVDGLRVTDDETMEVVEMVLGGTVNREIVELIQRGGGQALGLTGADGGLLRVRRRLKDGRDIGRVGEVVTVDPAVVEAVTEKGFIPVVAPIGVGEDGLTYNVNADEAAGALAQALRAEKLILLTDVEVRFNDVESPDETHAKIEITGTAKNVGKTGVEMEALVAVANAALTIYDMVKAVDRRVRIDAIRLVYKAGGKSGEIILE